MKKVILAIMLCLTLPSSEMVLAAEIPTTSAPEQSIWSNLLIQLMKSLGLDYLQDLLQRYLPETRATKTARMQEKALEAQLRQIPQQEQLMALQLEQLQKEAGKTPAKAPVSQKTITFADYIDVPQKAFELVKQLKFPERYVKMGAPLPHGVLLTGDPGTGKTHLARAIAGEVDCPFFTYSATDFTGTTILGAAELAIVKAFKDAREVAKSAGKNVAIIFIDEFDTIGSRSSSSDTDSARLQTGLVNTFLTQIDGFDEDNIKVITIAATNFPQNIDPALKRSGRLDTTIHISYPNEDARKKMVLAKIDSVFINPEIKNGLADKLAMATDGVSQAEISALFIAAGRKAIEKNIDQAGIDYDCFARTLWDMKKANYEKQLPPRPDKEKTIQNYLYHLGLGNISQSDLLYHMTNMTILDIDEVFQKAYKFALAKQDKTLTDWLWIAIQAKNQQRQIRQNMEVIKLCSKLYDPLTKDYSQKDLIEKRPDDIFNDFETLYNAKKINI